MNKNLKIISKSLEYFAPFKWPIFFVMGLIFVQQLLSKGSTYFMGKVVDAATISDMEAVIYFLVAYVILGSLIPIVISRIRFLYELRTSEYDLFNHVQKTSLFKSLSLSLGQLRREHSGFKQDILKSGENSVDYFHYLITDEILPILTSIIVSIVGMYFIGIPFFICSLLFIILYLIYGSYVNNKIKNPLREQTKKRTERSKVYVDVLRSLFFIKFANQKDTALRHLTVVQDDFRNHAVNTWTDFHKRVIVSDLLLIVYYIAITYFVYSGLVDKNLSLGSIVPIFSWMSLLANSMGGIRNIQRRSTAALIDLEKMFEMLEQKSDLEESENPRGIQMFENKITFEHVMFDYKEGKKDALKNINFEIKKGEKVALVGRSGSGKTTIISLLMRLYDPTDGTVFIDGMDLRSVELSDWHNLVAYVQQDGDLLDISIKENILFGARHVVTEAEIESVLEKAGIKEFIHNLPNGIDTLVGERGVKLSGGQKQRVCIARALIKDAPILLLDEATSSLDSETESVVNKAIWEMLGDKTGVVIAHRLSTILDADKIIVMDHGEIVGIGTHKQLLKSTPYYKKLVDAQNVNL